MRRTHRVRVDSLVGPAGQRVLCEAREHAQLGQAVAQQAHRELVYVAQRVSRHTRRDALPAQAVT